jgi:hypothetical protein
MSNKLLKIALLSTLGLTHMNTLFAAEKAVSEVASGGAGGSTTTTVAAGGAGESTTTLVATRAHRDAAMSALETAEETADPSTIEALRVKATDAAKAVIIQELASSKNYDKLGLSDKLLWGNMVEKCYAATYSETLTTFTDKSADEITTAMTTALAHRDSTATALHEASDNLGRS